MGESDYSHAGTLSESEPEYRARMGYDKKAYGAVPSEGPASGHTYSIPKGPIQGASEPMMLIDLRRQRQRLVDRRNQDNQRIEILSQFISIFES